MTISTTASRITHAGDGTTTTFAIPFAFFGADEIEVIERDLASGAEAMKVLAADYAVGGGGGGTGTVSATTAPAAGRSWTIARRTRRTQMVDYTPNDPFPAETHERALDRLTAVAQELDDRLSRAAILSATSSVNGLVLPEPEADRVLGWRADLSSLENKALPAGATVYSSVGTTGTGIATAEAVTPRGLASLWRRGGDLASATQLARPADDQRGGYHVITGTTAIAGLWPGDAAGCEAELRFASAVALVHDPVAFILPKAGNVTVAAGDVARFRCEGGSAWRCVSAPPSWHGAGASLSGMSLPVLAVSTNHTMAPTDCGREINFTQGGMKLNLPAAAAAGNGAMVAIRNSAPEATAYGNALGTGNRTGSITLSGNFSWDSGTFANLVDGSYANQCDEPGVGLAGLAGAVIQFDFGAGNRKYIDEIRIARSGAGNCGSWRVQASDDGVSWSVVSADFALTAASTLVACTPAQAGHRHYRLLGVSGNWSNVWWQEVEFRIAGAGGSGEVTIDPFAAETLDGQATRPLRRGGCVLLRSDGDGWSTVSGEYTYESGEQALVLAAVTTLAHGLGVTPKSLLVKLRCRVAELGYSAGDEVVVNPQGESNAYVNSTIVVSLSAASLVFVMNSHGLAIQHRTMPTPGGNTITLANWKIIFIAKDTY